MKAGCLTISILSDKTLLNWAKVWKKKESKEKQVTYDKDPQPQDFDGAVGNTKWHGPFVNMC